MYVLILLLFILNMQQHLDYTSLLWFLCPCYCCIGNNYRRGGCTIQNDENLPWKLEFFSNSEPRMLRKPALKIEGRSANRSSAFLDAFKSTLPGSPLVRPAKKWEEATHELQDKKKKHQHDIYKHPSNQPHATTSLVHASSTNSEQQVLTSDRADSASAEQTCGGNSDIAMKNVNGQGNSNIAMKDVNGQKCLSSPWSLEKIRKPSPELTNGLGKEFTTTKQSSQQLDLRKRLNSIYDSVLLVDNITIAKEVVGMLTNKYRHLVHACDTEVLFY